MSTKKPSPMSQYIVPISNKRVMPKGAADPKDLLIFLEEPTKRNILTGGEKITQIIIQGDGILASTGKRNLGFPVSLVGDETSSESDNGSYRLHCAGGVFAANVRPHKHMPDSMVATLNFVKVVGENPMQCHRQTGGTWAKPKSAKIYDTCIGYDPQTRLLFWGVPGAIIVLDPLAMGWTEQRKIKVGGLTPTAVAYKDRRLVFAADGKLYVYDYRPSSVQFIKSLGDELKASEPSETSEESEE